MEAISNLDTFYDLSMFIKKLLGLKSIYNIGWLMGVSVLLQKLIYSNYML